MLKVDNLYVNYGMIEALHGISFNISKGEIVALIGSNGACFDVNSKSIFLSKFIN